MLGNHTIFDAALRPARIKLYQTHRTEMRQTSILILAIAIAGTLLTGCDGLKTSPSEPEQESIAAFDISEMKTVIQEKTDRFTEAHITKDTAFLNNCFTRDAKIYPPNSDAVIGRSDIADLNSDWVNYGIYEFKEESTSFYGDEDLLIDEGTYYLRYGEENTIDKGKYINIWKMEDGEWKIFSNIWNTSMSAISME